LRIPIVQVFSHSNILRALAWEKYSRVRLFYSSSTLWIEKPIQTSMFSFRA
jgi:hypothetical protein